MNTIHITPTDLVVEPRGINKLWGFRRRITVPLTSVLGATYDPEVVNEPNGIRAPGLGWFNRWVGTFHKDGEKSYWCARAGDPTIVISLRDHEFKRLYLSIDNPRAMVTTINAAMNAPTG